MNVKTRIIAHRGASGRLPEHTLAAYALALAQGADVIEPDLVMCGDGVPVARHDLGLRRSTDIAARAAFAAREREGDWPVAHLRFDEVQALRAVQPWPQRDRAHDGVHPVPAYRDVLDWAAASARERGRRVVIYPELKHPRRQAEQGLDIVAAFIDAMQGVDAALVETWVQCFEMEPLQRVRAATGLPVFLLLEAEADWRAVLARHRSDLDGIAVDKSLLADPALVEEAHAAGWQVHAWTYRDDLLPEGVARVEDELALGFARGVDAVFCDFPDTALAARG